MRYVVQPGDSLWSNAKRCCGAGSHHGELARANGLDSSDRLMVGQVLWVGDDYPSLSPSSLYTGMGYGMVGRPYICGQSANAPLSGPVTDTGLMPVIVDLKRIADKTVRQAGGWPAAWAGMTLGAATGAFFGIETGPGAVVTGAVGGLVGGVAGYHGFDGLPTPSTRTEPAWRHPHSTCRRPGRCSRR